MEPTTTRKNLPGLGSIFLRGRTWYVEYWRGNVQHRESARTDQEKKAVKLLRQRRDEMARDEFIRPNKVTMGELFDLVVSDYTARDNRSAHTLAHRLKPLRAFFDHMRAADVTERTIDRYKAARLAAGVKKSTVNRELAVVRRGYKLATKGKAKLVSPNSVPAVEMFPESNAREGFVEYADFLTLVRHLPSPIDDVCWYAYLMGWRREQVLALRWADVNRDAGTVVRRAEFNKTKEPSVLAMSESVRAVIERRWLARTVMTATGPRVVDLVFHNNGRRVVDFRKAWAKACTAAGVSALFHDLRRSAVRNMENASVPRKVAMSLTGHLTEATYRRYHIVKVEDQRAALARVEAAMLDAIPPKTCPTAPSLRS
jgi:integrase